TFDGSSDAQEAGIDADQIVLAGPLHRTVDVVGRAGGPAPVLGDDGALQRQGVGRHVNEEFDAPAVAGAVVVTVSRIEGDGAVDDRRGRGLTHPNPATGEAGRVARDGAVLHFHQRAAAD